MSDGSPVLPKRTQHVIVESETGEWYIVSSLQTRPDVQVIEIEPRLGTLRHCHQPRVDLFSTVEEALDHLLVTRDLRVRHRLETRAILGYLVLEGFSAILVATKVAEEDAEVPGGHRICVVVETSWVRLNLTHTSRPGKSETKNLDSLAQFPMEQTHYYCETYDLTRGRVQEFSWNEFLTTPFSKAGMREWCPVLLQGSVKTRRVGDLGISTCVMARKTCGNPGTRFFARGLNERHEPGNEIECEMMVWTRERFCSFVWRRGTVPVWWKSDPKGVGVATITVRKENPFEGTEEYFERVSDSLGQPIVVVNLLRSDPAKEELVLSESYQQALRSVRKRCSSDLRLVNYDWHFNTKQLGIDHAIEGLWHLLHTHIQEIGISRGVCTPEFSRESSQKGVLRLNCADSLDRTNVASFFVCLQVAAEMCRVLDVRGFETSSAGQEWPFFHFSLCGISKLLRTGGLAEVLVSSFLHSGDSCSMLYTNSVAAHSGPIRDFLSSSYAPAATPSPPPVPTLSLPGSPGGLVAPVPLSPSAPSNALISVQRRYQNLFADQQRQSQYEMLTGTNAAKYFPSLERASSLELVSNYPAWVLSQLQGPEGENPSSLLSPSVAWTLPVGVSRAEVLICLRCPCEVREVAITVLTVTAQLRMDVRVGPYRDKLKVVYHNAPLPSSDAGTVLAYPMPPSLWEAMDEQYNVLGNRGQQTVSRFVQVTIRADDASCRESPLVLGRIEVYGRPPKPAVTPQQTCRAVRARELDDQAKVACEALNRSALGESVPPSSQVPTTPASPLRVSQSDGSPSSSLREYEAAVRKAVGSGSPKFLDVLRLEVQRLQLGLSASERDSVLVNVGVTHELSPLSFMYLRQEKIEAALWRSAATGAKCANCQETFGRLFSRPVSCHYCKARVCPNCMAKPMAIPEYQWERPHDVCRKCAQDLTQQHELLTTIVKLHKESVAAQNSVVQPFTSSVLCDVQAAQVGGRNHVLLEEVGGKETNVAEFPFAAFLESVPFADDSFPPEVLLVPSRVLSSSGRCTWKAPRGLRTVVLPVVLPASCVVTSVSLVTDSEGYTSSDAPRVSATASEGAPGVGQYGGEGSNNLSWEPLEEWKAERGEDSIPGDSVLLHRFSQGVLCRVLCLSLSLPQSADPSSRLHLARILITGRPMITGDLVRGRPSSSMQQIPVDQPSLEVSPIKPSSKQVHTANGKATVELALSPQRVQISGFRLCVKHTDDDVSTQVRLLRITAIVSDVKGEPLSTTPLGKFLVPKCREGSRLLYRLPNPVSCTSLSFDLLASYGSHSSVAVPKLTLF